MATIRIVRYSEVFQFGKNKNVPVPKKPSIIRSKGRFHRSSFTIITILQILPTTINDEFMNEIRVTFCRPCRVFYQIYDLPTDEDPSGEGSRNALSVSHASL